MVAHPTDGKEIPDKLFYRIGEVSRIAGVPATVLRFWEGEFHRIKPRRTDAGQRMYRRSDVELILEIKNLLYDQKFTIKGARQHLRDKNRPSEPTSPPDRGILQQLRSELREIRNLLD
ncbi:MAG: MerR family transcriptional regulator [Desulfobacteraceae bacterium]|jgi:DNA-binding transcriptional MerR regulator